MASITIRNLDDEVKVKIRIRAARHGLSMEEEVRRILRDAINHEIGPVDLSTVIRERFTHLGGVELELPAREAIAEPPRFE